MEVALPRLAARRCRTSLCPRQALCAWESRRHHDNTSFGFARFPQARWHAAAFHGSSSSSAHHMHAKSRLSPLQSCGFCAISAGGSTSSSAVATSAEDWLYSALMDKEVGVVGAAKSAFQRYGRYTGSEVAWRSVTDHLLDKGNFQDMDIVDLKELVNILANDARLTIASFWEGMTEKVVEHKENALKSAALDDLLELADMYSKIGCWNEIVFGKTIDKLKTEMAVHTVEPHTLSTILSTFSRAGRSSRKLSRLTAQMFNEAEDRLLDDAHHFDVEDVITIVESMARFQVRNLAVLQHLGRERLHASLTTNPLTLPAQQVAAVCSAYGELGWRHDTVFKVVSGVILEESLTIQRARALGALGSVVVAFSASDIALIMDAMLALKMHTGNTSWCKWQDNYEELLEVLTRRVEDEVANMQARPLAAASFVLGRARRGHHDLQSSMYDRMMQILETGIEDAADPPQNELARFLHGLVMMGPTRKKEHLDTQWLMHWMCHHPYVFLLSDLILINRHLVCLGSVEKDYLKEFVPWLTERIDDLSKADVQEITQTYNEAGLRDEDLGRHFFWALGRQYQKLHVKALGTRQRAQYRRIG